MPVKKKISRSVEKFIDDGGAVKSSKSAGFKNILVRIPCEVLQRLEMELAGKPWMNRNQWIVETIHKRL